MNQSEQKNLDKSRWQETVAFYKSINIGMGNYKFDTEEANKREKSVPHPLNPPHPRSNSKNQQLTKK